MKPHIGLRFLHKYWRDANNVPLVYRVSSIRRGVAYFCEDGATRAKEFVPVDQFHKVFGAVHEQNA